MANKPMKTLTIGETTYEIVDEQSRNDIETLKQNPVIETDDTLTQSGKAADAKVVGDALSEKQPRGNYLTEETDPTVPSWAKEPTKPKYTASEVGALPDTTVIPNTLSDLTTDSTHRVVTDSEKSTWNAKANTSDIPTKVSELTNDKGYLTEHQSLNGYATEIFVNNKIASIPTPDVSGQINTHNTNTSSHTDIREQIGQLSSEKVDKSDLEIIKDEIRVSVIESFGGNPVFGYVDENNNIILSGNLADGNYSIKYEMEDGSTVDIGQLTFFNEQPESMVNLLDTAYDTDLKTVYNGVGWQANMRISNSKLGATTGLKSILTGLIPFGNTDDVFHIRGVERVNYVSGSDSGYYSCWTASGGYISDSLKGFPETSYGSDENGDFTITMNSEFTLPSGTAYIRFQFGSPTGDVIITRNQLITV